MRLYDQLQDTPIFRWRLVTMSLRKTGDIARDVEATLKMRAGLMRLLRSKFGMMAGFGAVEQGDDNNIHLHALVYCRYVERAKLQSWLRSRDCTIRGCKHPADDRCEACISAKTACAHPDGVRVRCDGSWVVNVQMVRGRKGVQEAIKYAAAPVALHDLPTEGMPASPVQLAHAERLLRFYLTMQDRHRVETYGAAKEDVEPDEADDVPLDGEMRPCSQGRPLEFVAFGVNQDVGYVWFRTQFGSA
jgi:hypothetical protein